MRGRLGQGAGRGHLDPLRICVGQARGKDAELHAQGDERPDQLAVLRRHHRHVDRVGDDIAVERGRHLLGDDQAGAGRLPGGAPQHAEQDQHHRDGHGGDQDRQQKVVADRRQQLMEQGDSP